MLQLGMADMVFYWNFLNTFFNFVSDAFTTLVMTMEVSFIQKMDFSAFVHCFFIFELIFTNTVPVKVPIFKLKHDKVLNDVVRFS